LLELKHKHIVRCCDWSADSVNLVTGGKEAKLRLYDMLKPEAEPHLMLGHETGKAIKVVRYLPDPSGKLFLSAGSGHRVLARDRGRRLSHLRVPRQDSDDPLGRDG